MPLALASTPEAYFTNTSNTGFVSHTVGIRQSFLRGLVSTINQTVLLMEYILYKLIFTSCTPILLHQQLCRFTIPLLVRRTSLPMTSSQMSCQLMNPHAHSQVSQGIYSHLQSHRPGFNHYITLIWTVSQPWLSF